MNASSNTPSSPAGDAARAKATLRRSLRAARRALSPEEASAERAGWTGSAQALAVRAKHSPLVAAKQDCIAAYLPAPGEPDPLGAMALWHEWGLKVLVPLSLPERRLEWAHWTPQTTIAKGKHAPVPEPVGAPPADPHEASLIIVPALAVDRTGRRLGQGGGYYDSFLSLNQAPTVACIRAQELLDSVPCEPWDAVMGAVWTPEGLFDTSHGPRSSPQ